MFVNYKSIHTKSRPDAPDLIDLLEDLHVNSTMCFTSDDDENDIDDYIKRIVSYLHSDLEPKSSASGTSSGRQRTKKQKRSIDINGVRFRLKRDTNPTSSATRWELFAITSGTRSVQASCLVEFNDIYQTCEIHEVCVATSGQGYCTKLITAVRDHISRGDSGAMREIRVYCAKNNPAACACYTKIFKGCLRIPSAFANAFVYLIK